MNPSEDSILAGLSVLTVAEIADCAGTLKREARRRPDGRVTGVLVQGYGRVVQGTAVTFNSEAHALQHMDRLVTACVAWQGSHEPACVADACFSC
jgi:hypothetical protein